MFTFIFSHIIKNKNHEKPIIPFSTNPDNLLLFRH